MDDCSCESENFIFITKDMKVADVYEKFPQCIPVLKEFGFGALENPLLRAMFGRITSLERGATMHGVDLEKFLSALNTAASVPVWAPQAPPPPDMTAQEPQEPEPIKKILETNIADLVQEHPQAREILTRHFGPGCFDCPAFGMETARFACHMHQTDPIIFAQDYLTAIAREEASRP